MIKKILKYALCVLIVLGVVISIANFFQPELQGEYPRKVTLHENPPDCYGDPGTCNDFTDPPV